MNISILAEPETCCLSIEADSMNAQEAEPIVTQQTDSNSREDPSQKNLDALSHV